MKIKKVSAWLLCVLLLIGLFSCSVHPAGHDCEKGPCSVCGIIALLRILCLILPVTQGARALLRGSTQASAFVSRLCSSSTLVSLKIRLDN